MSVVWLPKSIICFRQADRTWLWKIFEAKKLIIMTATAMICMNFGWIQSTSGAKAAAVQAVGEYGMEKPHVLSIPCPAPQVFLWQMGFNDVE